jgi:DNA gyrase/topoisomerase IV subunit B
MTEPDYSLKDITVLEFDDAVRRRPGMYFGVGKGDPRLATRVMWAVVSHAFHPAATVAARHTPDVVAEITANLAFSVTDDQADTLTGRDVPVLGYYDSLLTSSRWLSAAAAAMSARTTVEVWRDGQGFRQRLIGVRPVEPPAEYSAPAGAGTRVTYVLDPAHIGSALITTDIAGLDVHGPDCSDTAGPGKVLIRDLREHRRPTDRWCY